MSQENVEVVRRIYSYWQEDALKEFDPADWDLLDPEIVWDASRRVFDPEVFHGHAGVREFASRLREVWSSGRVVPVDFVPAGDKVVVAVRLAMVSRTHGQELTANGAHVWTVEAGRITAHAVYQSKADALEAVGLAE